MIHYTHLLIYLFLACAKLSANISFEKTSVIRQEGVECGIHALFNAECFQYHDRPCAHRGKFYAFRKHCLRYLYQDGMYVCDLIKLRKELLAQDTPTTKIIFLSPEKIFFLKPISPATIEWFNTPPFSKRLIIVIFAEYHFITAALERNTKGDIKCLIADSDSYNDEIEPSVRKFLTDLIPRAPQQPPNKKPYPTKRRRRRRSEWRPLFYARCIGASPSITNRNI